MPAKTSFHRHAFGRGICHSTRSRQTRTARAQASVSLRVRSGIFQHCLAPEWRTFRLSNLLSWRDILRHDFCSGGELCGPEPAARTERASGQAWAGRSLVYESRFQFCAPPGYPDEPHQLHFSAPPVGQTPRMTTAE